MVREIVLPKLGKSSSKVLKEFWLDFSVARAPKILGGSVRKVPQSASPSILYLFSHVT